MYIVIKYKLLLYIKGCVTLNIKFKLTLDDYINLNKYINRHCKNSIISMSIDIFLIVTIILLLLKFFYTYNLFLAIIFIFLCLVILCFVYFNKKFKFNLTVKEEFYNNDYNKNNIIVFISNNSLKFKYDCIDSFEMHLDFTEISKITTDKNYLYVFNNNYIFLFIPLKYISEQQLNILFNIV